jgi:hypothetical protein
MKRLPTIRPLMTPAAAVDGIVRRIAIRRSSFTI